MTQFRSPLAVRLVLWSFLFSLVPILTVYAFMQGRVRETIVNTRLDTLTIQARLYSNLLEGNSGQEQVVTAELTSMLPESNFFLLGTDGRYIAHSDPAEVGAAAVEDLGASATQELLSGVSTTYVDEGAERLFATYRKEINLPVAVSTSGFDTSLSPTSGLTRSVTSILLLALLGMATGLGIVAFFMFRPSRQLAEYAGELGRKNFPASLKKRGLHGELGVIAESLTRLSENMQAMIAELEQTIMDRTRGLEKRAVLLKATSDVGRAITSVRNLTELLEQITLVIYDYFGYYHVGIFLLDQKQEYAVLIATNSEGGRKMLGKNHRLKAGETGIVGYVASTGQARIALDVGQDAVYFDNPDLPNTRSEMALPLVAGAQILGALDVQSTESQAFTEEDISTLQTLADLIAVAIQNSNLLNEMEKALDAARQVYGEVSREAWRKILRYQPRIGYLATIPSVAQTQSEALEPTMTKAFTVGDVVFSDDGLTVSLPIKVRGEAIGVIRLKKSEISETWTQEETNLAVLLSDQLSGALESARLYRESQQRAARESLVSDISARISSSARVETIIRETVHELGQTIGNATVTFQFKNQPGEDRTVSEAKPRKAGRSKDPS